MESTFSGVEVYIAQMSTNRQPSFFDPPKAPTVRERVEAHIRVVRAAGALDAEDEAVLRLLERFWGERPVTQREVARTERWLGCHPTHEADIVRDRFETTTRRVRFIVRRLKVVHNIPVLGREKGYYLPTSMEDADAYLEAMERKHRAMAKSLMMTYHAVRNALDLKRSYFEELGRVPNPVEEEDADDS